MDSLTQEQDKLVLMGTVNPSKDHSLATGNSNNSKGNKKANPKNPSDQKKENKNP